MIKLRINELLRKRGRSLYWLAKESGVRYATIWNLSNGQPSMQKAASEKLESMLFERTGTD